MYHPTDKLLFTSKLFSAHVAPSVVNTSGESAVDVGGWDLYGQDWRHFYDCMLAPVAKQAAGGALLHQSVSAHVDLCYICLLPLMWITAAYVCFFSRGSRLHLSASAHVDPCYIFLLPLMWIHATSVCFFSRGSMLYLSASAHVDLCYICLHPLILCLGQSYSCTIHLVKCMRHLLCRSWRKSSPRIWVLHCDSNLLGGLAQLATAWC